VTNTAVAVTNGLFTTLVDFGPNAFTGTSNWLEIAVRTNGGSSFTTLVPRQPVTPVPYAITAENANNLAGLAVQPNASNGAPNLIGGSSVNFVAGGVIGATIGGGGAANYSGSPYTNSVTSSFSTVGGGYANTAGGYGLGSTVAGGSENTASGYGSTVAGGDDNSAIGAVESTVGGGENNTASGHYEATVGGGLNNTASGNYATIPGGSQNVASSAYSFAAGQQAQATNLGAFVWADSQGAPFASTNNDSFNVRAQGGVRFVTGGAGLTVDGHLVFAGPNVLTNNEAGVTLGSLTVNGILNLPTPATIDFDGTTLLRADGNFNFFAGQDAGILPLGEYDNTGIGAYALQENTSGSYNTALGADALQENTNGYNNTAIGNYALYDNTSGSDNIGIGAGGGQNLTTGNNNIDIGNPGVGSDSGVIRIGDVQTKTYIAGVIQAPSVTTITITGGSDLAEPFSISTTDQPVTEGDVVVIDDTNPGQLKLTDRPYDTRVAGVVSGANGIHPGIQMHQQGLLEGGRNVALTGRVYVQADTSNGAIKPGDLLTTSSTPGRAMRVTDHAKAAGAILGKAMTGLSQGQGMVLVLVTLQ